MSRKSPKPGRLSEKEERRIFMLCNQAVFQAERFFHRQGLLSRKSPKWVHERFQCVLNCSSEAVRLIAERNK